MAALLREIGRERGWRRDRGDDRHARGQRFLDDLEARAAANQQDVVVVREQPVLQPVPDHLVQGVMPADVFAEDDQLARHGEDRGGVEAAGAVEGGLGLPHLFRER